MEMKETLGNAVVSRKTTTEIKKLARRTGMRTLREAGVRKIIEGITTVSEVLAVTFEDEILEAE
jgi:type IV pilus assembly protein PilB